MNNFTINSLVNFVENCLFLLKAKTKRQILFFLTFIFLGTTSVFSQAANLDQVRNGGSGSPTNPGAWVNGNLNSTQSHYTEGQSAPYRVIMTGMPANTLVTLELEYDVKHSGRHALDYLTHYDRLQPHVQYGHASEEIDPTIGTFFTEGSGFTTFTIPPPPVLNSPVVNQPTDSYNNLSAGEKIMTLWGGTITNITYGTTADLSQSNEPQQINVTFMTGNTALTAGELVLAWGGHIASRHDWGSDGGGVPRSAGGISGSPYHMRLIDWNLGNLGNQDRSLSAAAIAAPPSCEPTGAELVCANEENIYSVDVSGATNPVLTWEILDNTSGASFVGTPSNSDTSVTVDSGNSGGNYIVKVTIEADEGTVFCQVEVTVHPVTPIYEASYTVCKGGSHTFMYDSDGDGNDESYGPYTVGVHTEDVTDANGCPYQLEFTVNEQLVTIVAEDPVCGEVEGFGYYSVNVTTNEGIVTSTHGTVTQNNEVNWTISNIPNGQNITVTTTTSLGCKATVDVIAPDCYCIELYYEYTDVTCYGLDDGTIIVTSVSEGATVTINGEPYDPDMLYAPGSYTIKAFYEGIDNDDCIFEDKIDITEPELVNINAVGSDVTCYGANDGTISVSNLSAGAIYTIKKNGVGPDLSGQTYFGPGLYIVKAFLPENGPQSGGGQSPSYSYNPCESIVIVNISQPEPLACKLFTGFGTKVDCKNPENNWIAAKTIGQGQITYTWSLSPKAISNGWGIVDDAAGSMIEIIPGSGSATYYLTIQDETGCVSECSIDVSSKCVINKSMNATLYPNPVKDILNVKFDEQIDEDVTIEVYNLVGTKMFANTFAPNAKRGLSDMKVDFSRFPSHVYYVKIITKSGTLIKKVVLDK